MLTLQERSGPRSVSDFSQFVFINLMTALFADCGICLEGIRLKVLLLAPTGQVTPPAIVQLTEWLTR